MVKFEVNVANSNNVGSSSQQRFGHRKVTTSSNKVKDTPIKHGYHLEDYNRRVVYAHYYDNEDKPFYIGEGTLQRAFVLTGNRRTKYYNDYAKDINKIRVKILHIDVSLEEALKLEHELIDTYKRISDGGSLINVDYNRGGGHRDSLEKAIYQFDKDGNFIKEYKSISDASKVLSINHSSIGSCCVRRKAHHYAGGFLWRYAKEFNNIQPTHIIDDFSEYNKPIKPINFSVKI